jgi:hypothetical protein
MPGRWWLEAFVSGWFFWFYFESVEIKKGMARCVHLISELAF